MKKWCCVEYRYDVFYRLYSDFADKETAEEFVERYSDDSSFHRWEVRPLEEGEKIRKTWLAKR